ncbi:hypothetical protein A3742_07345 [Oleiphilus sp. HI0071]|uniref:ketopantoate reductase family protein n=1 Tax=Oleiphilus sp. HI0080 TaxID=1822255 RepID=UPI0007C382C1|nr:2-dehydropantoate 2-reductase [Oleiphilus sp. HI0080]KZY62164.1 hypothetical protein A3737_15070 [Oleiphilus sp. HI0065]KZY83400.1 hypothetical protein A3742_07345 [Oleiphilus sp. HI0071]KZY91070.1 hypothetical protein A3744_04140 [Oleiphilus sp. HI0073]KZZ42093.1 hypothetical protein A3758_05790 [Oleiphilus sp. HI0118]KZZ60459.1 hypothetical protein A3760_06285 [Oleiphilus sp. HI0122]
MIGICGAGAIGKLWAYRLGADNCLFISSRKTTKGEISKARHNIDFEITKSHDADGESSQLSIPLLSVTEITHKTVHLNAVLICTKSYDALEAALCLDKALRASIPFVLFQNGLGSHQRIVGNLKTRKVFAASTTSGANINTNGQLVLAGDGDTLIGALSHHSEGISSKRIKELLTQNLNREPSRDHQVEYSSNIEPILWKKLIINCGINAFTALENVPNGEISQTQTFSTLWQELIRELSCLAPKAGINASEKEIETLILDVAKNTGNNISSMLQDVRANKPTEIDDINGYACKILRQQNCSAHANQELTRRVHALRD